MASSTFFCLGCWTSGVLDLWLMVEVFYLLESAASLPPYVVSNLSSQPKLKFINIVVQMQISILLGD